MYLCTPKSYIDMIVCIAEKPSVARDIARIIGATASCALAYGFWNGILLLIV